MRSKSDPLVEEVELLSSNPQYALVKFSNGREDTVSVRDLAPAAAGNLVPPELTTEMPQEPYVAEPMPTPPTNKASSSSTNEEVQQGVKVADAACEDNPEPRRSSRTRREPERLMYS